MSGWLLTAVCRCFQQKRIVTSRPEVDRVMAMFVNKKGEVTAESLARGIKDIGLDIKEEMVQKMVVELARPNKSCVTQDDLFELLKQNDGRAMHEVDLDD